jgi:sugar-phosphatase
VRLLAKKYGLTKDVKTLLAERLENFQSAFQDIGFVERPGACALIRALFDAGIKVALATGAERDYAEAALKSLACRECFSTLTCGEDITHGKPAPDIYLAAAAKLGVAPEEVVAFEDAPAGVASAKAAGMKVVGVFDLRYNDALPEADLQTDSMRNITVAQLQKLFS